MSAFVELMDELEHLWLEAHGEPPVVSWCWSPSHAPAWTCRVSLPSDGTGRRRVFRGESGEQALRRLVEHLRATA